MAPTNSVMACTVVRMIVVGPAITQKDTMCKFIHSQAYQFDIYLRCRKALV